MTTALEGGEGSASRPGRSTSGKNPIPIVQEAGWAPGPVWTGAENLASTGIRSPDRPVRSQSLYHLRYQGHTTILYFAQKEDRKCKHKVTWRRFSVFTFFTLHRCSNPFIDRTHSFCIFLQLCLLTEKYFTTI